MKVASRIAVVACLAAAVVGTYAAPVMACTTLCDLAGVGTFSPSWDETLPVNLRAIWWTPCSKYSDLGETPRLTCTSVSGDTRAVQTHAGMPGTLLIDEALVIGDRCEITVSRDNPSDDEDAGSDAPRAQTRFTVTAAVDLPRALRLMAGPPELRVRNGPGDCTKPGGWGCVGSVSADLSVDDLAPWAHLLAFDVLGDDGEFHPVETSPYWNVTPAVWLAPGTHTVTMRARLPDGSLVLESGPHTFTIEACPGDPSPMKKASGGCSSVGVQRSSSPTWIALLVIGALVMRRVRSRRRISRIAFGLLLASVSAIGCTSQSNGPATVPCLEGDSWDSYRAIERCDPATNVSCVEVVAGYSIAAGGQRTETPLTVCGPGLPGSPDLPHECCDASDCVDGEWCLTGKTDGTNGPPPNVCGAPDACATQDACGPSMICVPRIYHERATRCEPAECVNDADCAAGLICAPTETLPHGNYGPAFNGVRCVPDPDTCTRPPVVDNGGFAGTG